MKPKQQLNEILDRPSSRRSAMNLAGGFTAAICALTLTANGEGFRNPPPGTFNLGRSGGRITHVDDASAIHQNPANLLELQDVELQLTPTVVNISAEFDSPLGQHAKTIHPWKFLPNLFVGVPLQQDTWAVGLGVTTPYGIGSEWDSDSSAFAPGGALRYTSPYYAELQTININPGAAVKLHEKLRFGAGLDVMWSELTLKNYFPWMALPPPIGTGTEPEGKAEMRGDGIGIGANLGLTWLVNERHRLALTYRSPVTVDLDGDFKITEVPPAAAAFLGATSKSAFDSQMRFPTIIALGYGFQVTDKIRLGADVEWLEFSRFDKLPLDIGNNNILLPGRSINQDWKDTFTVGIGGDWKFAKNWVMRAGYQFYGSPVPDRTFSPTIPDADQNVFTVGLGYHYHGHSLEAAYGADFYDTREFNNNQTAAFNGTYKITVHLMSLAYRWRF